MRLILKKIALPVLNSVDVATYHLAQRKEALRCLKSITEDVGGISRSNLKLCDEYALDVFKSKRYAPWLYVYCAVAREFKEGWIPDNYYRVHIVPKIKGKYGSLSLLKPLNSLLFHSANFPDILAFVNGKFIVPKTLEIPTGDIKSYLFKDHDRVVYKLDNSLQGRGIHVFTEKNFSIETVQLLGNGLFQSYITQHEDLAKFPSAAVSTLRLTTVLGKNGLPSVRGCYLRLGAANDKYVTSTTHIRVPLNLINGKMEGVGYTPDWKQIYEYPHDGCRFRGFQYPHYHEACSLVLTLHKKMPFVHSIGWDICVDRHREVKIMEWNGAHNDIKFSEATQGPCFSDLGWEKIA